MPTEQAMRAAERIARCCDKITGADQTDLCHDLAQIIDQSTGLPELLAERDNLFRLDGLGGEPCKVDVEFPPPPLPIRITFEDGTEYAGMAELHKVEREATDGP